VNPIILKTFKGRVPRVSAKLLPEGFAQTAQNCDLRTGKLEAMKGLTQVATGYGVVASPTAFTGVRNLIKIDRDGTIATATTWVATTKVAASFVRAQISRGTGGDRIYATGLDISRGSPATTPPVQTNETLWATGGTAATIWKRLGMVAPTTALTTAMIGDVEYDQVDIATFTGCSVTSGNNTITLPVGSQSHLGYQLKVGDIVTVSGTTSDDGDYALESWDSTGKILTVNYAFSATDASMTAVVSRLLDAQVEDSVSYVYTRVRTWPDGSTEESAPSEPTAVIDVNTGQAITLSGFAPGEYATDDATYPLSYRIYRLSSGTSGAEYQLLDEVAYTTGSEEFDDDSYVSGDDLHALLDVQDDILETTDWEPPPDALAGLIQYSNGIYAGFVGNKLYLSEPWVGYAWPSGYAMTFDYNIVALAVYNESILVLTDGYPYVVTGLDPSSMSQTILPYEQACVSRQGVVVTNVGVIYPSPDGLFLLTGNSGKLLTKNVYTKDQWAALPAAAGSGKTFADIISFFYDDCYYCFFNGTRYGFMFNFKDDPYIIDIDLGSGVSVTAGYMDPVNDTLYLVNGAVLDSWGTNSTRLSYTWKSALYRPGDASNFSCVAVAADGGFTMTVYTDGSLRCSHIHWLAWVALTSYSLGDIVTYGGKQWICITAHSTSQTPAAGSSYWKEWTFGRGEMFRLPGGYRARDFEFQLASNIGIDSVAIGQVSLELL
jgi:hypothetical protein